MQECLLINEPTSAYNNQRVEKYATPILRQGKLGIDPENNITTTAVNGGIGIRTVTTTLVMYNHNSLVIELYT